MNGTLWSFVNMLGAVLTAVLNSLWQAVLVALLAWALFRVFPRVNAATRYAVWWCVLIAILALPLVPKSRSLRRPVTAPFVMVTAPTSASPITAARVNFEARAAQAPRRARAAVEGSLQLNGGRWLLGIFAVWLAAFLFRFGRIVQSYRYLRGVKRRSQPAPRELQFSFDSWLLGCHMGRHARLLISDEIASPLAAGFLRPAVIIPQALCSDFTEGELDHVMLHELAHIARNDDWTNLAARLAGCALVFHPVAAWVLKRIEREREIACDDWVVVMTGEARPYAASLTRLFELCSTRRRQLLATGMADRASHLGERIETLLRGGRTFGQRTSLAPVTLGALILLGLTLAGGQAPQWIAFAQQSPAPPAAPRAPLAEAPPGAPQTPARPRGPAQPASPAQAARPGQPAAPPQAQGVRRSGGSFLAALVAAGYQDLSVDEIIELKNSGVSAEFLDEIGESGWGRLTAKQLIDLSTHGVSPHYLRGMKQAGLRDLRLEEVKELANHGVRPEFLQEIHALGFGPYNARQAIEFANAGLRPELFRAFKDAGFVNLDPREIIEAANNGLRASELRAAREYGPNLTLKQVIRLKQAGVI